MLLVISLGFGVTFTGLQNVQAVSPPNIVSYQGRVLNTNGVPVADASVDMKFELYSAVTGGTCLWSNSSADCDTNTPASTTARTVTLTTGLFTARLGDTADSWAAIGVDIFDDNAAVFLQVYIEGEALTPRKPIDAVPYALNAESLDGLDSTEFDLDRVYDNDSNKILNVDTTDLEFSLDAAGLDLIVDMQSDGDFILHDAGTEFLSIQDDRQVEYTYNGTTTPAITLLGDSLTTGTAMSWSLDALTTGLGIHLESTSSALTSGNLIRSDHTATYTSGTTAYTGKGLDIVRDITADGGTTTVNLSGPYVTITSAAAATNGGTLTETGPLFSVTQNNTSASSASIYIDANQSGGRGLSIDSEATTSDGALIDASAITTGSVLSLIGGNFTDDSGLALAIDVTESTETADVVRLQTDFSSSNNNVFRIEADGEVFSDIGFTAGAFSTNYMDGEIQTTADLLLDIDGGDLTFDQATIIGDGGDALTINSNGTLTIDDTVLVASAQLEVRSGGSSDLTLDSASGIVSTTSGDDFAVGQAALAAAFSIDESNNLMRLGDGSGTNASFDMYSSTGDTGNIAYSGDAWSLSGGIITHISNSDYGAAPGAVYSIDTAVNTTNAPTGGAGVYTISGFHANVTNDIAENGGGEQHEPVGVFAEAYNSTANGQVQNLLGMKSISENQSTNASAVGSKVVGVLGQGNNNAAATTVANVAGVEGEVNALAGTITTAKGVAGAVSGAGTVTTAMGGEFTATLAGTTRIGVIGAAAGGTNNYAGYFHSAATHIESTVTPSTANVATGAGDLFVWDALEIDGSGTTTSQVMTVDASTAAFMASFVNGGNNDNRQGISIQGCLNTNPSTSCNLIEFRDGNGTTLGAVEGDGAGGVTTAAAGSDYAELFDGTYADFSEGDVVALNALGEVIVASDSEDVIGVLSIAPNTLGNWVDGWRDLGTYVPVALLGQVPVSVNTEGGSIAVGDHLTLSSTTGVAKKATGVGYVLGRALESHSSGTGTIEIFIQPGWHGVDALIDDDGDVAVSSALTMLGNTDSTIEMTMFTDVTDSSDYKLSILNDDDDEVAFVNNEGDLAIAGRLYPSDRGSLQTDKYIYYDGSSGPGGDFMRTNASGWGAGSYDFAEMFPSAQALAPGEVVIFAEDEEHIERSDGTTYDQRIAGIISTQPGFLAGENIDGHVPVALSGRVPTYVSGENGDIAVGDPLTTSSKGGYAMKADEAGPIVGYAMETFSGDVGAITVFVRPSYYDGGPVDDTPLADNVISNLANASTLDLSGTVNFNSGQIINVAAITGMGQQWAIASDGTIRTKGEVIQLVDSHQGEQIETYATFSREHTIELSGTAELRDGAAAVNFEHEDAAFNDIIASNVPYRVYLTADAPTGPLYAVNRDNEGFSIRESVIGEERSWANVDWMVVAYHKDYVPDEDEEVVVEEEEEEVVEDASSAAEEVVEDESDEPEVAEEVVEESDPVEEEVAESEVVSEEEEIVEDASSAAEEVVEEPAAEPEVEEEAAEPEPEVIEEEVVEPEPEVADEPEVTQTPDPEPESDAAQESEPTAETDSDPVIE